MRLFALLTSLVLLVTSSSFGTSFTGTSKFDTAIITSLIAGDIRGFFRAWELSTSDDSVTVDVNGYLEIAADSGTTFTGPVDLGILSILRLDLTGASSFGGVATFDSTAIFNDPIDGVYADIDSIYCDVLGVGILAGLDSVIVNHSLLVGGLGGTTVFYDDVRIDSTLTVLDLTATGTVDLGGITDTLVIGADSFQVLNGVIVLKF